MKGNRQFNNLFLSNATSYNSTPSSRFFPIMKQSQYFDPPVNFKQQASVHSANPSYFQKNVFIQQANQQNSLILNSQINGKHSVSLEESRSQIINPIYTSPIKKNFKDDLDQSGQLGTSKASQVTFSKPSEFIINSQKQSVYLDNSKNSFISSHKFITNDYGYIPINTNIHQNAMKSSTIRVLSPMKQSYFKQDSNICQKSIIFNQSPTIPSQTYNVITNPINPNKIFRPQKIINPPTFNNQNSNFGIKPQLRRALSNISIMSQKSKSKLSATKVNFNYISPPKSQNKMGRKLSFKKQDAKNPLSKLAKKKQQVKSKLQKSPRQKVNSQAINQYFPEFKIKKNKMKTALSPRNNVVNFKIGNNQQQKSQISQDDQRRHTFIASLDAFSQISQIKQKQKEQSTQLSTDTPKKLTYFESQYCDPLQKSKSSNHSNSITFNRIQGHRITFEGHKMPPKSPKKDEILPKQSDYSKQSQLSVNSIKNGEDIQFLKKHGNDSSHTTDYEQQIVRKIKQDLGLNFSYHKK